MVYHHGLFYKIPWYLLCCDTCMSMWFSLSNFRSTIIQMHSLKKFEGKKYVYTGNEIMEKKNSSTPMQMI